MRGRWRVRKRVRVGRLLVFNLTGRSVSGDDYIASIGWRGLTLNLSARGIYVTLEDFLEQGDEPWIR